MIYITGDLHGTYGNAKESKFLHSLSSSDILIVLGDFGWTWNKLCQREFHLDCTTLFIDGNHENFNLLYSLPEKELLGSTVGIFNENTYWLKRGNLYNIEGKSFFCFGGALSIDKAFRLPGASWWPEEIPSEEEYERALQTLKANDYKFDYLLTHTCSEDQEKHMLLYEHLIYDPAAIMIGDLIKVINENGGDYKHHFFGHHHKLAHNELSTALYSQVYCLNSNTFKYF